MKGIEVPNSVCFKWNEKRDQIILQINLIKFKDDIFYEETRAI